ncbi:hypothetical protein GGF32_005345 [Allomyces javanicus]|nr:hypothetical protein GGF32_005345 [Allomyces javanicus]
MTRDELVHLAYTYLTEVFEAFILLMILGAVTLVIERVNESHAKAIKNGISYSIGSALTK